MLTRVTLGSSHDHEPLHAYSRNPQVCIYPCTKCVAHVRCARLEMPFGVEAADSSLVRVLRRYFMCECYAAAA